MTKFQGILLTLKKRMRSIREADGNHYKYVVFGFYDGLDINVVATAGSAGEFEDAFYRSIHNTGIYAAKQR